MKSSHTLAALVARGKSRIEMCEAEIEAAIEAQEKAAARVASLKVRRGELVDELWDHEAELPNAIEREVQEERERVEAEKQLQAERKAAEERAEAEAEDRKRRQAAGR